MSSVERLKFEVFPEPRGATRAAFRLVTSFPGFIPANVAEDLDVLTEARLVVIDVDILRYAVDGPSPLYERSRG